MLTFRALALRQSELFEKSKQLNIERVNASLLQVITEYDHVKFTKNIYIVNSIKCYAPTVLLWSNNLIRVKNYCRDKVIVYHSIVNSLLIFVFPPILVLFDFPTT